MTYAESQLEAFMARYLPDVADCGRRAIAALRWRYPGAQVLVYDNYNALAVGFAPTLRPSSVVLSIALYPRWVSLFFMNGVTLPDPFGLLTGSGNKVRHRVLETVTDIDHADIVALIDAAWLPTPPPITGGALVIQSISAKQRSRQPG